jgi:hypothetical protein
MSWTGPVSGLTAAVVTDTVGAVVGEGVIIVVDTGVVAAGVVLSEEQPETSIKSMTTSAGITRMEDFMPEDLQCFPICGLCRIPKG